MKVLLVDDHPLILSALQNIIQTLDPGIAVLSAGNPQDAFALLDADTGVELLLFDLNLGQGVDGFAVLADLRERYPALPVVVVSGTERLSDMVRVIDMGAMGFVSKCSPIRGLTEALALMLAGGVYIPPALLGLARLPGMNLVAAAVAADEAASRQPARWQAGLDTTDTEPAVMRPMPELASSLAYSVGVGAGAGVAADSRAGMAGLGLTPRQTDVLTLLLKGLPNKLIARELNVSVDTVKDHVAAVLRALGVSSRTQAVLVISRLTQQAAHPSRL
jgi:DNA-binding NarL/FixJ family response regulator